MPPITTCTCLFHELLRASISYIEFSQITSNNENIGKDFTSPPSAPFFVTHGQINCSLALQMAFVEEHNVRV